MTNEMRESIRNLKKDAEYYIGIGDMEGAQKVRDLISSMKEIDRSYADKPRERRKTPLSQHTHKTQQSP